MMFKINRGSNSIDALPPQSFGELGFRERQHLQEWIATTPSCLGEELLIIQKEFAGFSDTQERLDLLAIDKQGSLVLIENKLDDTGRDVTWQALKYASYCSRLSKENIKEIYQEYLDRTNQGTEAETELTEFLEADDYDKIVLNKGATQRIILVAANFRKEVTSTVLWLLNFKLRVQCFKVTPWSSGNETFLGVDQIIPTKDVEEFMIGLASKALGEVEAATEETNRQKVQKQFWTKLLEIAREKSSKFGNISAGQQSWIAAGSGIGSVTFNFVAGRRFGRVELYIDRSEKAENKAIFDELHSQKANIQETFGDELTWERLDKRKASRIKAEKPGNILDEAQWLELIEFMTDRMVRLEKSLKEPLEVIRRKLRAEI